jgi:predicted metal-dependent peptidase
MSLARQKRLERAQMRVLFQVPFFASGVAKLLVIWDDSIPTACTNGEHIRWNGAWFDSLPDAVLPTVLCHEVAHPLLGHLWRIPSGADWRGWNIATDHAVNLMLKDFSEKVMAQRLADPFPFPDPQDAYCADPQYAGMSEEAIYARLPKQRGNNGGGSGKSAGNQAAGPNSMPSFGDIEAPKGSPTQQKNLQNDWKATLIQSVAIGKAQGNLPAGLERLVDSLVNPVVPWPDLLRAFLREQVQDDWNWSKPDPLFDESGFILPSLDSEGVGVVVFATDTSGSIDEKLLAQFQSEKQACLDELRPRSLVDIYCDAKIQAVNDYRPGEIIGRKCPGGGGTDFSPVFAHIRDKMGETPKAVVYLTDLMGSFPDEVPPYPVLWVTWEREDKAPFGEVVFANPQAS